MQVNRSNVPRENSKYVSIVTVLGSVHTDQLEEHRPAVLFSHRPGRIRLGLAGVEPPEQRPTERDLKAEAHTIGAGRPLLLFPRSSILKDK